MSDDLHGPVTMHGPAGGQLDPQRGRFLAFLALALGVLGALGGGIVGTALQWLVYTIADLSPADEVAAVVLGGVPVLLGVAAVVLGLQAGRSTDDLDAPVGRVGAVLGGVAVVGGVLYAIALLAQ